MKTKSIRISDDMQRAVATVEKEEKVEEATAIRKLIKIGYETYIADRYREGKLTLAEAARRLGLAQSELIDLLLDRGIKGNLDVADVMASLKAVAK